MSETSVDECAGGMTWVRRLLDSVALRVLECWEDIATQVNATGTGASVQVADELAIPTIPSDGKSPAPQDPSHPKVDDMRDVMIAKTKRALDEAAQLHLQAMYGHEGAGVLIDWVLMGETVDANLDDENDKHSLYVATSADMTSWKLVGFASALGRYVYSGLT